MFKFSKIGLSAVLVYLAYLSSVQAQEAPGGAQDNPVRAGNAQTGPIQTDKYRATYVKLGASNAEGLLYEPAKQGSKSDVAVVFTFPRATFGAEPAPELASRGYRVLLVTPFTEDESPFDGVRETSQGIRYLRTLPGIQRVVVMSHSGGGRMMAFYVDVALNGPAACQNPEILYPCKTEEATDLAKPDGLVLLDSAPGAFNTAVSIDPAFAGNERTNLKLDMYSAANGFDAKAGSARYSDDFRKRYFAAQSARNMEIVNNAVAQLKLLQEGKATYKGDMPLVIPGAVDGGFAASLHHVDTSLLSHTKHPHTLLKADGTAPEVVIQSVRPPIGSQNARELNSLCCDSLNYTVRHFLANDAIRTTKDFAETEDDILGVDWKSSLRSTPGSAEGITVPTLVLAMSCFQFIVPDEIIYDHLAAKDKTYAAVEGALHNFGPCKPDYGDTKKRTFDFVDNWLSKPGRF
jgi:hypothetical protein